MQHVRRFHWGLSCLLAAAAIAMPAGPARSQSRSEPPRPTDDEARRPADPHPPPYFVILNTPADFDALLQKIRQPDLEIRRVDPPATPGDAAVVPPGRDVSAPWVVESVRVRGRVRGDSADLKVDLTIAIATDEPTRVPIRLDDQRLIDAREGTRVLDLRMAGAGRWEVEVEGRGVHRVEVDLRCPLTIKPARAALALAIPEAPSTSLELDFDRRESDLIVGANEVYGQADLPDGKGARLSAHLTPRPRVEVSWAVDADANGRNPPLLTAQGDIAIDIDTEQMRTRSSWVIRCVRGMTRTLEVGVHEQDEVTELRLDDQQTAAGIEGARGASRLTIPLGEPFRPGEVKRLVLKTRRSYATGAGHRIGFEGFPVIHAREQSGAIGVTQSTNLWVAPVSSQNLRRIPPTRLPQELRERPATSLAFEFLDQPFSLVLDVEESPPLVRSQSRTLFRIDGDRAKSETMIELQWIRGRLFEVELDLGPGLEVVSVGPTDVVEASNLTRAPSAGRAAVGGVEPRGLTIRLAAPVRDQNKVTLRLEGYQRLPREGPVRLGLFAPDEMTAVAASFTIAGDRGLSVELDDDAAHPDGAGAAAFRVQELPPYRSLPPSGGTAGGPALVVEAGGSPRALPVRITRHARSVKEETLLSAEVSRRYVELLQKTTFTVRHGALGALEIRVPPAIPDRWELDREVVDRQERAPERDGSRLYRLFLDRPVLDRATLTFRYRLPISPALDASDPREVAIPRITFPEAVAGPARVELATAPGVVFRGGDSAWAPATDEARAEPGREAAGLSFTEGSVDRGRSFTFRALAMEPVALPALVVPRLLIKSSQGFDGAIRCRAWYWVETHGPVFPFAMPEGARLIAARVGGRAADPDEFESSPAGYRLRFPSDAASRPALVELDYQLADAGAGSPWPAPQLQDGGVVLQTLWEARLPWDQALLGVPRGWSDENEWYWAGNLWIRRPWKGGTNLAGWILGDGAPAAAIDDLRDSTLDESHHLLFSRAGKPVELGAWIVSRPWLVAVCSGVTLVLGFIAIFARIRFRTAWAVAAGLALLAAAILQPSLTLQLVQSALVGAALTVLGLLIQRLLDRRRAPAQPGREPGAGAATPLGDPATNRGAGVGSDDSTAIRVRAPSTMDYVPSPLGGPSAVDEAQSSTLGRA